VRIASTLREAARGLAAPPAARLRFLEELRGDLEDLQSTLLAAGVPASEAKRRAELMLAPGEEALEALSRLHRPLWSRWRERAPVRGGRAIGAALCLLMLVGVFAVWREAASLRDVPLFLVPLAGIGVAAALRVAGKALRIWVAGDAAPKRMRAGSEDLLVAALGAACATAFGVLFELYRTASLITTAPAQEMTLVLDWLRRSVVLGAAGIAVALPCGLAWLFFVRQAAGQERRERALLGADLAIDIADAPAVTRSGRGTANAFPDRRNT
jgi:hypothetical protein